MGAVDVANGLPRLLNGYLRRLGEAGGRLPDDPDDLGDLCHAYLLRVGKNPQLHFPTGPCLTRFPTSCKPPSAISVVMGSCPRRLFRRPCARSGSRCSRLTSTFRSSRTSSRVCASAPPARR